MTQVFLLALSLLLLRFGGPQVAGGSGPRSWEDGAPIGAASGLGGHKDSPARSELEESDDGVDDEAEGVVPPQVALSFVETCHPLQQTPASLLQPLLDGRHGIFRPPDSEL